MMRNLVRTLPLAAAWLWASPAWAQEASVDPAPNNNAWLGPVLAIALAMAIALVSFMKSRREYRN
ncbi:MAG: hypothetical protein K8S99_03765 [Planctomycetes bacterium]|nr:hypothetical protein [Planctomycetota bacterium]